MSYTDQMLQSMAVGLTLYVLVLYPLLFHFVLRRKSRAGRRVEYTGPDGIVRHGTLERTAQFGTELLSNKTPPLRVKTDDGTLMDIPPKRVKPVPN